jgi:oxygen-dependent protoporphyrinogen oxidase
MTTDTMDGYVIDRGAQFLSSGYPLLSQLIKEVGLADSFVKTSPWVAIRRAGKIHKFRYDNLFSPVQSGLLHGNEWLKMAWRSAQHAPALWRLPVNDYSRWDAFDTENAADWYNTHFGTWMTEYFIEPMLQGFYFQSPEETSRALPLAISGFLTRQAQTMTRIGGIGCLAEALARQLDVRVNEPVPQVTLAGDKVIVRTSKREIEAAYVLLAVPGFVARNLLPNANACETALMETPYASTLNLALGVDKSWNFPAALQGVYGILLPRRERQRIAAVAVETAKSPDRAKSGHLLNVMLESTSGAEMLNSEEPQILQTLLPELELFLPGLSSHLVFHKCYRWQAAEPKSPVGRARQVRNYRAHLSPTRRVLLAGDYMGMPFPEGAAETGQWAASQILMRAT